MSFPTLAVFEDSPHLVPHASATSDNPASCNAKRGSHDNAEVVPLRCLIVDDNPHFLEAARGLLQQAGIVVGVASSSADALAKVEHFHPDVTLVDIQLGEESGLDLARTLAEAPNGQHSAVILCSAHSAQDFACLTDDSPAIAFLPKSDLSATAIHEILQRATG